MSPINIPPEGKGQIHLMCQASIMGKWRECEVIEADSATQWVEVRLHGSLFTVRVQFSHIQNVALKYADGTIVQNFGSPKLSNPASLEFIQYQSVQS